MRTEPCPDCGGETTYPCPCVNYLCFFRRNDEAVCLSCLPVPDTPVEHIPAIRTALKETPQ